jgi:hypothetical protein
MPVILDQVPAAIHQVKATLNKPPISAMPPVAFRDAHALMVFEGKSGGIDPHCMAAAHAARHAGALMP